MISDKLREIAKYRAEVYECPDCGVVSDPDTIHIDEIPVNREKYIFRYVAQCPDCGYKFGPMKKSLVPKFWTGKKYGACHAADLSKTYLEWMIKVNHFALKNDDVRQSIMEAILDKEQQELDDIPDIEKPMTKNEYEKKLKSMENEIDSRNEKIERSRERLRTEKLDYFRQKQIMDAIESWTKQVMKWREKIKQHKNGNSNFSGLVLKPDFDGPSLFD